jgi:hypothetical protein
MAVDWVSGLGQVSGTVGTRCWKIISIYFDDEIDGIIGIWVYRQRYKAI